MSINTIVGQNFCDILVFARLRWIYYITEAVQVVKDNHCS